MDERGQKLLQSVLGKRTQEKIIAKGGKAAQSEKRKDYLLLERSHGGLAGTVRGGSMRRGKEMEREREEKQGTYFPVYPNLRDAKRLGGGKQRDRRRKVEEETRACYCD